MSEHLSPRTTRFSQQGKLLIHTYLREIRPIDTEKRRSVQESGYAWIVADSEVIDR